MSTAAQIEPARPPSLDPATRETEVGEHVFVWARPRSLRWRDCDGRTWSTAERDAEFRPCMPSGRNEGRRLWVIGSAYAYQLDEFEIAEDARRS